MAKFIGDKWYLSTNSRVLIVKKVLNGESLPMTLGW